jgi:hypothetical protein
MKKQSVVLASLGGCSLTICAVVVWLSGQCLRPARQLEASPGLTSAGWVKAYGADRDDQVASSLVTSDMGLLVCGHTESYGEGSLDILMVKMDLGGRIQWARTYGGTEYDQPIAAKELRDGGFIIVGRTNSFGAGEFDGWILKLESTGTIVWQKAYGSADDEMFFDVVETADDGLLVVGETQTLFPDLQRDGLIVKVDSTGAVMWQKTYGSEGTEEITTVAETGDGGSIVTGYTTSFGAVAADIWVLRLTSNGTIIWEKTYGASESQRGTSLLATDDGGALVAGWTYFYDQGSYDPLIIKLDSLGEVEWQRTYGGDAEDFLPSASMVADGYLMAGYTSSFGQGEHDGWVLKLDDGGAVEWEKTYGGPFWDGANSVHGAPDGGIILVGETESFGQEAFDIWVVKADASGEVSGCTVDQDSFSVPADGNLAVSASTAVVSSSWPTVTVTSAQTHECILTETCVCAPYHTYLPSVDRPCVCR